MSNANKPIKFALLQKLGNQSMFNGVHMIEMKKTYTVAFMKAQKSLVVGCRETHVNLEKKQWMLETYFLKFLLIDFG